MTYQPSLARLKFFDHFQFIKMCLNFVTSVKVQFDRYNKKTVKCDLKKAFIPLNYTVTVAMFYKK